MGYTIMSVDWDYFFPDVMRYDWGHRESRLFIETLWPIRATNRSIFPPYDWAVDNIVPNEKLAKYFFDRTIEEVKGHLDLVIVESHADLQVWLDKIRPAVIYNFDQHHDLHYNRPVPPFAKGCQCDDWAGWGIKHGMIKEYNLYLPEWRRRTPEYKLPIETLLPKLSRRVAQKFKGMNVFYDPMPVLKLIPDVVFICRSGAWTPSWADDKWHEFVGWWKKYPVIWENRYTIPYVQKSREPNHVEALALRDHYKSIYKPMVDNMMKGAL